METAQTFQGQSPCPGASLPAAEQILKLASYSTLVILGIFHFCLINAAFLHLGGDRNFGEAGHLCIKQNPNTRDWMLYYYVRCMLHYLCFMNESIESSN